METPEIAQSIEGDKLYQVRAKRAFPLLVRQALTVHDNLRPKAV
jgi:hypothetical protein